MASNTFAQFATVLVAAITQNWWLLAASAYGILSGPDQEQRMRRQAAKAQDDAAKDRLEMLDLEASAARTLVLGRVRYVEGVRRRWREYLISGHIGPNQ